MHLYEKVGFVGIVPVKVLGKVKAGDYIIASGENDGTGIAVPRQDLPGTDLSQIVGVAWESSRESGLHLIRTAIGLSSWSVILQQQQQEFKRIDKLEAELAELKELVKALSLE